MRPLRLSLNLTSAFLLSFLLPFLSAQQVSTVGVTSVVGVVSTVGTVGSGGGGGGGGGTGFRRSITIDHTQVTSTLTDFPVLVSGTYSYLATEANGGKAKDAEGDDVGFYSNSDCSTGGLKWEVSRYDATTGAVVYRVKLASISSASDTTFYMCYGRTGITTDQSDPASVWDAGYLAVMHGGDGTTVSPANSKTGGTGRSSGVTATTGQIYGGITVPAGNNFVIFDGMSGAESIDLPGSSDVTISFWFYRSSMATDGDLYKLFFNLSSSRFGGHFPYNGDNNWYWDHGDASNGRLSTSYAAYFDRWTYVVMTGKGDDSFGGLYLDGVEKATRTIGAAPTGASENFMTPFQPGADYGIDEYRLSTVVRSAAWIAAEYANEKTGQTFYTIGSEVAY